MIVGTAGHIDHGKTSLVRALTGVDTDRLPEERRRGITIELGFAPLELPGVGRVGVVDVPGHEGFVRTMVAGATGVDVGLLVIAADEGVMPQTREHLVILEVLAIRGLVVAVTKCDLVDADWLVLVREEVSALLATTSFAAAPIVEVSARSGSGLDGLRLALASTMQSVRQRDGDDLFRLPIDRAFSVKGTGTVITGTSWTGTLSSSQDVRLYPGDIPVRVRGLQVHGEAVDQAPPGSRLAVALAGVDVDGVKRGMFLATPAPWVEGTRFHADVEATPGAAPFRPKEWLRLHVGTAEVSARVVGVGEGGGPARIVTEEPVVLRAGDRFVLRRSQPLSTVGGGIVIDPSPDRRRRRPSVGWLPDSRDRMKSLLEGAAGNGALVASIPIRIGVPPAAARALCEEAVVHGDRAYLAAVVDAAAQALENEVLTYLASHATELGAPQSIWSVSVSPEPLAHLVVARLVAGGRLEHRGPLLAPSGWEPHLPPKERAHADWVSARLAEAGREPPSVEELEAVRTGVSLLPILRFLEREGSVVAVEPSRYYHRTALEAMVEAVVAALRGATAPASPATLRDAVGVSRKYLMPFLEYCDRQRITERQGEGRVLTTRRALS